jgi:hypothetical protein
MCYGPEFLAKAVQEWIAAVGAKTAYARQPVGERLYRKLHVWTAPALQGFV